MEPPTSSRDFTTSDLEVVSRAIDSTEMREVRMLVRGCWGLLSLREGKEKDRKKDSSFSRAFICISKE